MQPGQRLNISKPSTMQVINDKQATATINIPTPIIRDNEQGSNSFTAIPAFRPKGSLPSRIKYTMDNTSDSVNSKAFYIFDAIGACTNVFGSGVLGTLAKAEALTAAIVNAYLVGNQVLFSGFRAQSTVSSDQFTNPIIHYAVDLDGQVRDKTPIFVEDGLDGKTFDNRIQNFRGDIHIDQLTALGTTVNAGEKLQLSLFVKGEFNRV